MICLLRAKNGPFYSIFVSKNWAQINININNSDRAHVIYSRSKRWQ